MSKIYNYKDYDGTAVSNAFNFAFKKHEGQTRWGGEAYISHPVEVSQLACNYNDAYGYVVNVVALLHDVIEDCYDGKFDIGYNEIKSQFGEFVADTLMLLTHDKLKLTYTQYIENIVISGNIIAMVVKMCDLEHNLSSCYDNCKKNRARIDKYEMSKTFLKYAFNMTDKCDWRI